MKGPGGMLTGGSLLPGSFPGAQGPAGYADRQSVDQLIADRIGTTTTFKSLEFGVRVTGGHPLDTISYAVRESAELPHVNDPVQMYARMFANTSLGSTSAVDSSWSLTERACSTSLRVTLPHSSRALRATISARLDAHLTGIRTMGQQLASVPVLVCDLHTAHQTRISRDLSTTDEAMFAPDPLGCRWI